MTKGQEAFNNILCEGDYRYFSSLYDRDMFKKNIATVKKELQALEIIKEKKVFVANLIYHFENNGNVIDYNTQCGWAKSELTLEEYNLLKEVLNDEHR